MGSLLGQQVGFDMYDIQFGVSVRSSRGSSRTGWLPMLVKGMNFDILWDRTLVKAPICS